MLEFTTIFAMDITIKLIVKMYVRNILNFKVMHPHMRIDAKLIITVYNWISRVASLADLIIQANYYSEKQLVTKI